MLDHLEELPVGEVGVGDDHLVHLVLVEDAAQVVEAAEHRQVDPAGRRGDRADELVVDSAPPGAERPVEVDECSPSPARIARRRTPRERSASRVITS